jgi:hypothetical protein
VEAPCSRKDEKVNCFPGCPEVAEKSYKVLEEPGKNLSIAAIFTIGFAAATWIIMSSGCLSEGILHSLLNSY